MNPIIRDPRSCFCAGHRAGRTPRRRQPRAALADAARRRADKLSASMLRWAETLERTFIAERGADGEWADSATPKPWPASARGQLAAHRTCRRSGQVVVLSDNSVEHALLMLAAMHVGVPVSAISAGLLAGVEGFRQAQEQSSTSRGA